MLRWKTILVATDFSDPAERALRSADAVARGTDGRLVLLHVVEPAPPAVATSVLPGGARELETAWVRAAESRVNGLVEEIRGRGHAVDGIVRLGRPWEEILQVARDRDVDAICLGSSGHSRIERLLLGSTADNVVRRSPVPVLVVRDRALGEVGSALLPVDFDEGSEAAVAWALANLDEDTDLLALHVVAPLPPAEPVVGPLMPDLAAIREDVRRMLDEAGADRIAEEVRLMADPAAAILERARDRDDDLIVLATHGRHGLAHFFLGSVTEKIVRHAERPVLVLPGPGREEED